MKRKTFFPVLFAAVMLICAAFIAWYLPANNERLFQIEDTKLSLETSQGRERRQQHEYDQALASIPEVQEKLDSLIPLNEAALEEKKVLKAEQKALKKEKETLQKQLEALGAQGGN